MPIPAYIVCSQSGAVDAMNGIISFFNVMEALHIRRNAPGSASGQPKETKPTISNLRITAAWMREDADGDATFEVEVALQIPGGPQPECLVSFAEPMTLRFVKPFARAVVDLVPFPPIYGPGIMYVEARIRRAGEQDWTARQRYPILLQDVTPEAPVETPPTPPANGKSSQQPTE